MNYRTVMLYTRTNEYEVMDWCENRFEPALYEITTKLSAGGTVKGLVILFEKEKHKLLFDLAWTGEHTLYKSMDDLTSAVSFSVRQAFKRWKERRIEK